MNNLNTIIMIILEFQTVLLHICIEYCIVLVLNSHYCHVQDLMMTNYTVETVK